jgi:AcrR family transcriptional regulator
VPRRPLSDARKAQILAAAVSVVAERGLADTRIADVAERVGASPALVMYYFKSKDRLLAEALAYSDERFYRETSAQLDGIASCRERLCRLIELSCASPDTGPDWLDEWLLWLDMWARAPRDPEVARDRHLLDRRWREAIADIVRRGQGGGEFGPADPDDFALQLAALVDGLSIQVVLRDPDVSPARMLELCLAMASSALGFELPKRIARRPGRSR